MYIQEEPSLKEQSAPPDYSGHTYQVPQRVEFSAPSLGSTPELSSDAPCEEPPHEMQGTQSEESTPAGAFGARGGGECAQKGGKRGDFFGNLGLSNLFSRVPFLSSLAPPPRRCEGERKHGELWDWVLLALVALSLLGGHDDDVLPILLLLLLWD